MTDDKDDEKTPLPFACFNVAHGHLYLRPQSIFGIYDSVDGCNVLTTFGQGYKVKGTAAENHTRAFGETEKETVQ